MSMGEFELRDPRQTNLRAGLVADQRLHGVMRFLSHRERLSLDTMRRVGEAPMASTKRWSATRSSVRALAELREVEPQLRRAAGTAFVMTHLETDGSG